MMAKVRAIETVKESERINCEDCQHFSGEAYLFRFGCAKGHDAERSYSFLRASCNDHSPLKQHELIFKRYGMPLSGDASLQNKKANIRRTATHLRHAMVQFDKVLNAEQIAAIQKAVNVCDQLGDDVERAAELAKKYREQRDAEYAIERQMTLNKIAEIDPTIVQLEPRLRKQQP